MKPNYFFKSLVLVVFMALVTNVNAKEFIIPDGATNVELTAALEEAKTGDVILINGIVTMNSMVDISKNVTIKIGDVNFAAFDGQGITRLFDIHPEVIEGAKLVFEGLDFYGGNGCANPSDLQDGGAARIFAGETEFISCYFSQNEAKRGGAIFVAETGTKVTFRHCEAWENVAHSGGGDSRGGYLFVDGDNDVAHEFCKISANQSIGGRGGALCLFGNGTRRFYYTVFSHNKAGNWIQEGGNLIKADKDNQPTSAGEYEGGVAFITGGAITFESCGFVGNQSFSHSAIIRGWGDNTNVTFVNSVFSKNETLNDQAPIWNTAGTWTFVNCILAENLGSNPGNGGVFRGGDGKTYLNIFNSVWVRNTFRNGEGAQDLTGELDKVTVKNSIIGLVVGDETQITVSDNHTIPTKSNISVYKLSPSDVTQSDYALFENTGIDFDKGLRYSKFGMPYYLLTNGSMVTKLGDPALLADCDLDSDMFGRKHSPAADGSIVAGPVAIETEDEYDDVGTSINNPAIGLAKENIRVIGSSNGILAIDFGDLKGSAKGRLISVTGQEVENVFSTHVVSKGYYNMSAAPGMYILEVKIAGKTYTQKLIVTK